MDQLAYVVVFSILIALFAIVPIGLRRYHVPAVVSIMIAGILIGPSCLDVIGHVSHWIGGVDAASLYQVVDAIGFLGLVFLMALAGLETDLALLRREIKGVCIFSVFSFTIPSLAGFFIYRLFDDSLMGAFVYASLFASHSIGIVFPVLRELGVTKTRFGVRMMSATVVTDILSLIVLAVCVQVQRQHLFLTDGNRSVSLLELVDWSFLGNGFVVMFIGLIVAFIVTIIFIVPWVWQVVERVFRHGDDTKVTFFLLTVLVLSLVGELLGISIIVSAFVTGVAVARTKGFQWTGKKLQRKLEGVGFGLVIPFLFISVGFKANPQALWSSPGTLVMVVATVTGLVVSKISSGWLAMRLGGFDNRKGLCAGLMTVPQLSATLAAASVAVNLNMISNSFFNAIIVLSLVTTIPVPMLVRLLIEKGNMKFEDANPTQKQEESGKDTFPMYRN